VILYAETSAVLRWILGQADAEPVRDALSRASRIVTSVLTVLECERAFIRIASSTPAQARAEARTQFLSAIPYWTLVEMHAAIRARASKPFPVEPIRTLDALHLATIAELEPTVGPLRVLSTDDRVVSNCHALGWPVLP